MAKIDSGKTLDTTLFDDSTIKFGMDLSKEMDRNLANEHNFVQLCQYLAKPDIQDKHILKISMCLRFL